MAVKTKGSGTRTGARTRTVWYLRIAIIGLVAVAALLAAILLGGGARADKLRAFDTALFEAQRSFLKHFDPGARTNLLDAHRRFADGELSPDEIEALASTWEEDFTAARDAVRMLDPHTPIAPPPTPEELIQATWFIAESLEAWRGIAALYPRAAELRRSADAAGGTLRTRLVEQLDALLEEIRAWQVRASNLHELGARQVHNLRQDYGVTGGPQLRPAPPAEEVPSPDDAATPSRSAVPS